MCNGSTKDFDSFCGGSNPPGSTNFASTKQQKGLLMSLKDNFIQILKKVNRDSIDTVIVKLTEGGFFEAPASTRYHGNYPGGLVEHSLNVYEQAMYLLKIEQKVRKDVVKDITEENIIVASLLHDVCKMDLYHLTKKWKKDENNKWIQYDAYEKKYESMPLGHGEKSVIRLMSWGFPLQEQEMLAIRWHMGGFDLSTYQDSQRSFETASEEPLVALIVAADWLASRIKEKDVKADDN